jgi:sigma-E factor negative regulatory protein RseA
MMTGEDTLSALMDDEAQELELRRLLRDLDTRPEERQRWARYNLARAALRGEPILRAPDFAASVRAALDGDAEMTASSVPGWRRAVASFAVAASVATIVVLGGQQMFAGSGPGAVDQARVGPLPVGVVNTAGAVPVRASFGTRALPALQPAERTAYRELARQRLRRYSLEHAEHAALNTPAGMVPFARVPLIDAEAR